MNKINSTDQINNEVVVKRIKEHINILKGRGRRQVNWICLTWASEKKTFVHKLIIQSKNL